jgi:Arc/MetJ family transcription regulator
MSTNLAIDDNLILKAKEIGGFRTKKEAVTIALQEFIKLKEQKKIISMFNKIGFDSNYDYKKLRSK